MRLFNITTYFAVLFALVGCLKNDIPYPIIKGDVVSIEVSGSVETKIDHTARIITVELSDSVDLRRVRINDIDLNEDAKSELDSGSIIDLTNGSNYAIAGPYTFTVTTYQDYEWKIEATQPIVREIAMTGSIGDAIFDTEKRTALVNLDQGQDLYSITVTKFSLGSSIATYSPNPFTISDWSAPIDITMNVFGMSDTWRVTAQHTIANVITEGVNPWSTFAYMNGSVSSSSTAATGFEYREVGSESWLSISATPVNGAISGIAKGLLPNHDYEYRAFLGTEYGEVKTFTSEIQAQVPNLDFEESVQVGNIWYFNASGTNSYWATGNEGLSIIGSSNTVPVEGAETQSGSGKAVKMETLDGIPFAVVAAGNMYTGTYETTFGTPQEMAKSATMGRPYSGRPTTLSGYFKYTPQQITDKSYWKSAATAFGFNFEDSVGKMDWAHIYIKLEKWPENATVRPDESLIETIGYGEIRTNKTVSDYTAFTIPIEYSELDVKPTHISIVATSSVNGGYFCGAAGSLLYIDSFSLGFDYVE